MKRLFSFYCLLVPVLALAAVPTRAEGPTSEASAVFSRRVALDSFGSAPIARDWRISWGPAEATFDGVPKWSVEVCKTSDPTKNRLLPDTWHGLQLCEIAPALVPTNEVRILPIDGAPWLLRLSLEGIGVANGKEVRGEVAMDLLMLNANESLAAKGLSVPSAAEVAQFRFWEGRLYLREAARTEGVYRHPVSRTEGEAVLSSLANTADWTIYGMENYLMPVREIDMVLTNGIVRTFRFWGGSCLAVLSDDSGFLDNFHLPASVFSAIDERMTAWRGDVVEAEKTWYRNLPLPREYRAHDGPDSGTLSGIAALFYGNGSKWRIIWDANKTALPDPNIVRPGLKLTIPALNADPSTP